MSEATRPAKETIGNGSSAMVVLLLVGVLLPVLYVLSIGPVIMMIERGGMSAEFWAWFYGPVRWLHQHVEFSRPFLDWYVELWR